MVNQSNKIETFSKETRIEIWKRDKMCCSRIFENGETCRSTIGLSTHHLVANTILNKKLYGEERIQSLENGKLVCYKCHTNHNLWDMDLRKALINKWNGNIKDKK